MAKRKAVSKPKLVWKKSPNGGEIASYRLGIIKRINGKYSILIVSRRFELKVSGLKQAKEVIDAYTENRRMEL